MSDTEDKAIRQIFRNISESIHSSLSSHSEFAAATFPKSISSPKPDAITGNGYGTDIGRFKEKKLSLKMFTVQDRVSGTWHIWAGVNGQGEKYHSFISQLPFNRKPTEHFSDNPPANTTNFSNILDKAVQETYGTWYWYGIYFSESICPNNTYPHLSHEIIDFYCDMFNFFKIEPLCNSNLQSNSSEITATPRNEISTRNLPPSTKTEDQAVVPPFEGYTEYIARVKSSQGLSERNMEDLVKELLIILGHDKSAVVFQAGHIDVLIKDKNNKPIIVIEVKKTLLSKPNRDAALRQVFDYASRNGAPIVVITDSDLYEIYDRRKGLDHASMLQTKFQLTAFRNSDKDGLSLLKP